MKNRTRRMMMLAVCMIWPMLANPVGAGEPECMVPADCDDANDCTVDTCKGGMCIHTPVPDMTGCDDGDNCTYDDYCDYGVCYGYAQWCTDTDDCTIDYCLQEVGCVNEPIDCDDGNPCTADDCDFQSGCFYSHMPCPAGESCNPNTGECAVPPCLGDLNWDGNVDAADLAELLAAWGSNPGHPADFDGDGVVDSADLAELLAAWGTCE